MTTLQTTIGEYTVLDLLGKGGQGTVYRVQDPNLVSKQWALKLVRDRTLYGREASILRALGDTKHPAFPLLGNAFTVGGEGALVLTYFPGQNLADLAQQRPGWRAVWGWIQDLAEVLQTVHAAGFLHLDLKPENVIRSPDGRLRLLDFASSVPLKPDPVSEGVGTPGFAAPEQMRRGARLSAATDVYGLGALAVFLLEGQAHVMGTAVKLSSAPPSLAAFVDRMLHPQPEARPTWADVGAFDPERLASVELLSCPGCARENRKAAKYCGHCGGRLQTPVNVLPDMQGLPRVLPPTQFEAMGADTQRILDALTKESGDARRNLNVQRLRLLGESIAQVRGFDRLIAPDRVRHLITSYEHQVNTVERALREMRGNAILADEVGLGKTVEAGLIVKELFLRGLVSRVLVLVPPHLPDQWVEEMNDKLDLPFRMYEGPDDWGAPLLVASIRAFTHGANRSTIERLRQPYDLIVVDEMHNLLNQSGEPSRGWELLYGLPRKYLLLLSATPVRRHIQELYHLVTLIRPGHFESLRQFQLRFESPYGKARVRNSEELRTALQEVMIRHSRQSLPAHLLPPRRQVVVEELIAHPHEKELIDTTLALARRGTFPNTRVTLEAAHSSLHALADMARPRVSAYPPHLQALLRQPHALRDSKVERALEIVREVNDQVIVFTRNRHTADAMARAVRGAGLHAVQYLPGLSRQQRAERFYAFKGSPRGVLIATEGAAEGRNLQFCQHLINLDLPWNPLRLEQRIGRIDRIGQRRTPTVHNLFLARTFEAEVHRVFNDQLHMFTLIVGELATVLADVPGLGNRTLDDEFARILVAHGGDNDALLQEVQQLGARLASARRAYDTEQDEKSDVHDLF